MPALAPLRDFSGGLNLVAAPSELAANETPDCMDVTLDERAGVVKRLGLPKIANVAPGGGAALTGAPLILFYSAALDKLLLQVGTGLYKSDDGGANWSASLKTFSTSARVGICDFLGKAVIIHPADGCFTYDGTASLSAKVANSPNGSMIGVFQNTLLSAGDPSATSRVTRSDIGAITWPVSPITSDFRVKDDTPITALSAAGANSFIVWKEESFYRVSDVSTAIGYVILSPSYGASGPLCVAVNQGLCAAISRRGIIVTDGIGIAKLASAKLEPLFRLDQLAFSTSADWCAGNFRDRFVFSFARTGAAANDTTIEYHPILGWMVPHSFGMRCFTTYTPSTRRLLGAKIAADTKTATFDVFKGGTDDGAPISSRYQTPWLEPFASFKARLLLARVIGRGNFTVEVRADYGDVGIAYTFSQPPAGMLWGVGVWGVDSWGQNLYESPVDLRPATVARALSFVFSQSSSSSVQAPKVLRGSSPEVGDFACYGLELDLIQLEAAA